MTTLQECTVTRRNERETFREMAHQSAIYLVIYVLS